jgi:hypothetical protein
VAKNLLSQIPGAIQRRLPQMAAAIHSIQYPRLADTEWTAHFARRAFAGQALTILHA